MFAAHSGHLSFPGNPSKPHNSSTLPRNPSPRGRVKLHCLRPLPPPDPAPALPLRGIWGGGGAGVVSSLGTDPKPAFSLPPGEGLPHLSRSPLLPPTAAWENSCLFHTGVTAPSGRREFPPLFCGPTPATRSPHAFQARTRAGKEGDAVEVDAKRALGTVSTNGTDSWTSSSQILTIVRHTASGCPKRSEQILWAPPGAQRLAVRPHTASHFKSQRLASRISPREPNYLFQSFKPKTQNGRALMKKNFAPPPPHRAKATG